MQLDDGLRQIINLALAEDIGNGDITASLLENKAAQAKIISRQNAVICGIALVNEVFRQIDANISINWQVTDGDEVIADQVLCYLTGSVRALLSGERTALNFLQTLSSTSTLTKVFVDKIRGTKTQLLDTRKTLPGLRAAQKYAVICGGGKNHRQGLYDAVLIKENHIAMFGSITGVVHAARDKYPDKKIEIEVKNLAELQEALTLPIDIVMLDNFSLQEIKQAVKITKGKVKLEVSGGVNLDNIRLFAETGVDYVSVGALTKTVIPIELSMLFF
jgi:nicotinate-nucleotide pyrophosphorylase (carboxylating)